MATSSNKFAIVTGASQGIGRSIAIKLASLGFDLCLIARNNDKLVACQDEIVSRYQTKVVTLPIDVTDAQAVKTALSDLLLKVDTLDVLVNSAGFVKRGTSELAPDEFTHTIKVNLLGVHHIVNACIDKMKTQQHGHIINIASMAGRTAPFNLGAYAASKFGLVGYSESLYKELAAFHIKVTTINPGVVNTQMTSNLQVDNTQKMQPSDIAETVEYVLKLSPTAIVKEVVLQSEAFSRVDEVD